ncbi:hypothetical protein U0070_024176 [Myodes glareolus]|uniref:Uncharacterized protein n=1 Tax=Myodes glareolus TaxID=447135 RepID=A0AAW0I9J1_MYOGA
MAHMSGDHLHNDPRLKRISNRMILINTKIDTKRENAGIKSARRIRKRTGKTLSTTAVNIKILKRNIKRKRKPNTKMEVQKKHKVKHKDRDKEKRKKEKIRAAGNAKIKKEKENGFSSSPRIKDEPEDDG